MLRNVLVLITGTKRECTTKTFLVYDENGEENVVLLSVILLYDTNTCLREKKKKLPVFDRDRNANDLKFQLFCSTAN